MELQFIENNQTKKIMKRYRIIEYIYLICMVLIIINHTLLCFETRNIKGFIINTVFHLVLLLLTEKIKSKHLNRIIKETLWQEICIDGFINLNFYKSKKIEKKLTKDKYYKKYNSLLLNIIEGYIRYGDYNQAKVIIDFLDDKELDNTQKAILIFCKATIAFNTNNIDEFKAQYKCYTEIINSINNKIKRKINNSIELKRCISENNDIQAFKICDRLINDKFLLNNVEGAYYKGVLLEKNNNEEYNKFYKYVVEHGNDLKISKIASEKTGIVSQIRYKKKLHLSFKIFTILLSVFLLFYTIFNIVFYTEICKLKKWDTGIVYVDGIKVELPCNIAEIEKILNITIDREKLGNNKLYTIVGNNYYGGNIQLYIDENIVTGIKIKLSSSLQDTLNHELGENVEFPENITANCTIKEIKETYSTGIINPSMREMDEIITGTNIKSYEVSYTGDFYNISAHSLNGIVDEIFYYKK